MFLPSVLRHKNFARLYTAGLTSELGSFITDTALMVFLFELSEGQKGYLGFSKAIFLAMLTLGSLLGGPLGEKFNRRKLLIVSEVLRFPLVIILLYYQNIYSVIIINGLVAFLTGIYNPSRQAMVNELVPSKDIAKANSLFGSTMAILHMAGPFFGASIYAYTQSIDEVLIFDLITYILGAVLLLRIAYIPPQKKTNSTPSLGLFTDLKEGFNYTFGRSDLRALVTNTFLAGFCIGVLVPLLLPYVQEVLGRSEIEYGWLMTAFGLGGMIGGLLFGKLSDKHRSGKIITYAIMTEPLIMPLWVFTTNFWPNLFLIFLWGILVFVRIPAQLNYISETVETNYLTRVHSLLDMSFVIPSISGGMIIALINNSMTTIEILGYTSLVFFLVIIPRFFTGDMQSLLNSDRAKIDRQACEQ